MASIKSIANPEMLVWARKSSGLPLADAARKANVKTERLAEMESGKNPPTISQLQKLGEIYKRPIAIFFLSEPPEGYALVKDYRSLPGTPAIPMSPTLRLEIRRANARREYAIDLTEELGEKPLGRPTGFRPSDSPMAFAAKMRNLLRVDLQEQREWSIEKKSLKGWQNRVESLGVLVFQAPRIELREMRGFSISEWPVPAITINSKDTENGKLFTLLHEFAHVLMGEGGICTEMGHSHTGQNIEKFCNEVAAQTLVPNQLLYDNAQMPAAGHNWADSEIVRLSRFFGVSREVIVRRFLENGLASTEFYEQKRDQFITEYMALQARKKKPDEIKIPQAYLIRRDKGEPMVKLVLRAYLGELITSRDVSEYLGMKLKHLPKLEELAFGSGQSK